MFRTRAYTAFAITPQTPIVDWLADLDASLARSNGFFAGHPVALDLSQLHCGLAGASQTGQVCAKASATMFTQRAVRNCMREVYSSSFDPQTLVLLEAAFDEAWLTLKVIGNTTVGPTNWRARFSTSPWRASANQCGCMTARCRVSFRRWPGAKHRECRRRL